MNYRNLFAVACMGAFVLTGCSDDVEPGNPSAPVDGNDGANYVNISINLPTVAAGMSRAGQENDQFDDGDVSEYKVTCAHLVVFKASTANDETTASVSSVYNLTGLKPWNMEGTTADNVTSTAQMVQEITETPADNLWMLVVLNDPQAEKHFTDKTFAELTGTVQSNVNLASTANGFFMTNAPLYKNGAAQTLVKLDQNAIYNTSAAAAAAPAVEVYVERALAKVTVTTPSTDQTVTVDNDKYVVEIENWGLDITNNSSYVVRNVSSFADWKDLNAGTLTNHRFYSSDSERIYWAIDPNYSAYNESDYTRIEAPTNDLDASAYCLENTFDVAHMNQNQTTRVVFKATFHKKDENAATVYTIGTGSSIYDKATMQNVIINAAINNIEDKEDGTRYSFAQNTSVTASAGDHEVQVGDVLYDGKALSAEEIAAINSAIGTIHTYVDGVCYYVARVQHFGDTYTPWQSGDLNYGQVADSATANKKYLGRYGVVRNNWYELAVSGIKTIGDASIPEPKPTPDDESKNYINFKVNMHSWAKRVQNVEL